jgi:SAM-dependent methyltransferase
METKGRPLRILDLASGGGDVAIGLWRRAARAGLPWEIEGWDLSPTAVAYANGRAAAVNANVRFVQADSLTLPPRTDADCVMTSLFLHHLDEEGAIELMGRMARATKRLVLINDLVRTRTGLLLAYAGTRMLSMSDVVHIDGPLSVAGAFTMEEVRSLAARAGLHGAAVARRWPCRFLLTWERT